MTEHPNSFDARGTLKVGGRELTIFRLDALQAEYDVARLPYCLKVLLENLLRTEGNGSVTTEDAMAALGGDPSKINPLVPAELVIDHSVQVDSFGSVRSFALNPSAWWPLRRGRPR